MKEVASTLSVFEFFKLFPDEASAVTFMETELWKNGAVCVFCGSQKTSPRHGRMGHRCKDCRKDFTVRHNTIFENSRKPLRIWLYVMYLVQTSRKGVSSLQLSKEIGVTQKTAWFMLHRIREACSSGDFKLDRVVEVDETYLGGKEKNKHNSKKLKAGRGAVGKQAVIGAKERGGAVRAQVISNTDGATLKGFIHGTVAVGSTVYTDEHKGYHGLGGLFYQHGTVKHSAKEYVNGMAHTNGIESVWALLKRGYHGTYHNWSVKHCQKYVDEFTFRLNQGNCEIDTIDRIKSLCAASVGKRLRYADLVNA